MSAITLTAKPIDSMESFSEVNTFIDANPVVQKNSIEHFIIENSAQFSVQEYAHKLSTTKLLSDPKTATNPEVLMEVQKSILDYGLQMSLASALTRKAIGAVEGLMRG